MALQRLLYPFLLSLYFILLVFSENLGDAYLDQSVRSILLLTLTTAVSLVTFSLVFKSIDKAAFVTSLLLVFIFIIPDANDLLPAAIKRHGTAVLIIEVALLLGTATILLRRINDWTVVGQALSLMVVVMLALVLYRIANYAVSDAGVILEPTPKTKTFDTASFERPAGNLPNIYYILLDGYARADALRDYFGHDNTGFIEYLEGRGFYVANQGVANYNHTLLATGTVLNFEYIADEDGFKDTELQGWPQIIDKTYNNRTAAILSQFGYRTVSVRSTGDYMRVHNAENLTLNEGLNEFEKALLFTTLIPQLIGQRTNRIDPIRERVDFVLEEIVRQSKNEGPMFLIAHIMAPHQPFVYGRSGEAPLRKDGHGFGRLENLKRDTQGYADQVYYLNILLRDLVDEILANSETPPIIVLQGDHGLRLSWWINRENQKDREQLEDMCLRETFANLNALYLPGVTSMEGSYETISPVNTFRLIFDSYFGSDLGLVDDRSFFATMLKLEDASMSFIEVTGAQETCNPIWEERFLELQSAPEN